MNTNITETEGKYIATLEGEMDTVLQWKLKKR
jgi:hypothetical protein